MKRTAIGFLILFVLIAAIVTYEVTGSPIAINGIKNPEVTTVSSPGETAVVTLTFGSTGNERIELQSLSLISVPGFMKPRLVQYALIDSSYSGPVSSHGWPPQRPDGSVVKLIRFRGSIVNTSYAENPNDRVIVIGVDGGETDSVYADAGVKLRYSVNGKRRTSVIGGAFIDCVVTVDQKAKDQLPNYCKYAAETGVPAVIASLRIIPSP